jgi:hypothetical protein
MSFDPAIELPLPLVQVPKLSWLPRRRRGRKIHVSTIFRWVERGIRGTRLEAMRVGGTLCTSEAALKRFFSALSAADPLCSAANPAPSRTPAAASRAQRNAEKRLQAAGI